MLPFAAQLLASTLLATASLQGTVRSADSGRPLPGATVTLEASGEISRTDSTGRYHFALAPTGTQRLTIRCLGHATFVVDAIVPRSGEIELDVALEPVPLRLPRVAITSTARTTSASRFDSDAPDRSATALAIAHHPLAAEPDALRALAGGDVSMRPETAGGLSIRGGGSDQIAYTLNGIPILNPYHVGGLLGAWNPDALDGVSMSAFSPATTPTRALSGTVAATTRASARSISARGATSSTHLRLAVDGPLTSRGATFLLSARSALPTFGVVRDPSYLRGESGDWLATLETPLFGGRAMLLGLGSDDEQTASREPSTARTTEQTSQRNLFGWTNRSLGLRWDRVVNGRRIDVTAWQASAGVDVTWHRHAASIAAASSRRDHGVQAVLRSADRTRRTMAGIRLEQIATAYRTSGQDSTTGGSASLNTRVPVATVFTDYTRDLPARLRLTAGASLAGTNQTAAIDSRVRLQWTPRAAITMTAAAGRTHQFVQSLRNPESVVSHLMPVELFVAADGDRIPVARSDHVSLSTTWRPTTGLSLSALGYTRAMTGVLAAAATTADPFAAVAELQVHSGAAVRAHGLSANANYISPRVSVTALYGWNDVEYRVNAQRYQPEYNARHMIDAGVRFAPTATSEVKIGAALAFGRRTTPINGAVEWEACNLIDRGCEFTGSPASSPGALGETVLPRYMRADVSIRKHWRISARQRGAELAVFGTLTNVFGRTNVLNYTRGDQSRTALEMRPRAPLVLGMDWRF
jgi:Carboxypeptidase regulatory-like domain/TonB-dependent Receptor Plug Domain